jgi:phage terminase Nu1 subunit (DNA packaging protein)
MAKLLGLRAYARHRGCDLKTVQEALEIGRIAAVKDDKGRPKIDPEAADMAWQRNTDPVQQQRGAGGAVSTAASYIEERAKREAALARLAELELAEKTGDLVHREAVRAAIVEKVRVARAALLGIPDRLAARLAAETDPKAAHALLLTELRRICAELEAGEVLPRQ